jgi:asparagine synthetase B (glutamine-hydrolysing)
VSGLAAWFDPDGVDPRALEEACAVAAYRGEPTIELVTPKLALAVLARRGDQTFLNRSATSVMALDGRVDAVIRGQGQIGEVSAPALLQSRLEGSGPDALADFAADFAVAWTTPAGGLSAARDAFGLRPLYWGARGHRTAFASDPAILVALGLATDDLDPGVVAGYLARFEPTDGRTAFRDVQMILPGWSMVIDPEGRRSQRRWFDPERLRGPRLERIDAVEAVRASVHAAIRSRAGARKCAIALSGGRDSGSIAVATAEEGIDAVALTQTFDDDLPVAEAHLAKELCRRHDLRWEPVRVTSSPEPEQLEDVPRWSGTPLSYFAFPQATAVPDAASALGVDVLLTGEGGEPFFTSSEISVLDLLRAGRPLSAIRAARAFHDVWGRPYSRIAKVAARAVTPGRLLNLRERKRPLAPWVKDRVPRDLLEVMPVRSDRQELESELVRPAPGGYLLDERLCQTRGIEPMYPLLDLRVVSVALSMHLEDRAPIEGPKPLLGDAFLGPLAADRVKMSFVPYYERLTDSIHNRYPDLFSPVSSLAAERGFLDGRGLAEIASDAWKLDSLGIAVLEAWLRWPI